MNTFASYLKGNSLAGLNICTRCIYDETVAAIHFDEQGVCNYCHMIENLKAEYQTGTPEGEKRFQEIVDTIKKDGRGKKYDCVIGVSGGTDSSYMVHKAIEMGLRPLAVHYDNTWNSATATSNIHKVLKKLNVDLFTYVVDNKEIDDIIHSVMKANVPEIDGHTDIALAEVLYRAASKYGVKYILEGHSFIAEGVSPLRKAYVDGKYISDVHKKFGKLKMKTFPNMTLARFLYWILFKKIKKIRPFWYLSYSKEDAKAFLQHEYGWEYYGGHHLENRLTAFSHSFYGPVKFESDQRNNSLGASARSGKITRDEALNEYAQPPYLAEGLLEYFMKRLHMSEKDFTDMINGPKKYYVDYKTYKPTFERLAPLFYLLAKVQLVPKSFYIKYCSKAEV